MLGHDVDCNKLLLETDDGDQSEFMECVRTQYLQEIFEFPLLIHQALMRVDQDHTDVLTAGNVQYCYHSTVGLDQRLSNCLII